MNSNETPVVFIAFNRPDVTAVTFAEIRRNRPKTLLLIADGPRPNKEGEAEKCRAVRQILSTVDWDCQVFTNFSDTNLGCKVRVSSGLSWAFSLVDEAIILEDDCFPDQTFFRFASELLRKYRTDNRIFAIAGSCLVSEIEKDNQSYTFTRFPFIWGWATWKRAWDHYDVDLKTWPRDRKNLGYRASFGSNAIYRHYDSRFKETFAGKVDTWDYQFTFAAISAKALCIIPNRNLIKNIGFGPDATHTIEPDTAFNPPLSNTSFPLIHPTKIEPDNRIDVDWMLNNYSLKGKVRRKVKAFQNKMAALFKI